MNSSRSALRLLLWLKFRAYLRSMRRRVSTPSGVFFGLLGLLLMGAWLFSLLWRSNSGTTGILVEDEVGAFVRAVLMMLALFSGLGALAHRGLYLPAPELERLLSAPIARSDLVRFRMLVSVARTFTFASITALVFSVRLPERGFAVPGLMLSMLTLPVIGQAAALTFGDAENRLGRLAGRFPIAPMRIFVGLMFWLLIMAMLFSDEMLVLLESVLPGVAGSSAGATPWETSGPGWILTTPLVHALTLPAAPWSAMITASDLGSFARAFGVCSAIWLFLFECVARLPIDFRQLSLETSADVAKRLGRMRSGRSMMSAASVSKRALGWRIPWFFGRGPFGAVAWLKSCAILRKARGTLLFYVFVMTVLTLITVAGSNAVEQGVEAGCMMIALLGTVYLGMGLRFDFRSDLDSMESIKAWPLSNRQLFIATILPEVVLISLLVSLAVMVRAWIGDGFSLRIMALIGAIPTAAFVWTALDNAVFLFAPVRYTPGQGGSMHYAGRSMMLVLLRMLLLALMSVLAFAAMFGTRWILERLGFGVQSSAMAGVGSAVLVILGMSIALVYLGGCALSRFDMTREVA